MRLKKIILLSYLFIILVFTLGIVFLVDELMLDYLTRKHVEFSLGEVLALANESRTLSKKIIVPLCEGFLRTKAENQAFILGSLMKRAQVRNFEDLKKDALIREIAIPPLYLHGEKIGYFDLMDGAGLAVFHPNPQVEGKNYAEWQGRFPQMWALIVKAMKEGRAAGYYDFLAATGEEVKRKYMVVEPVPDFPYYVTCSVYTDALHMPLTAELDRNEKIHTERVEELIESHALKLCRIIKVVGLGLIGLISIVCIFIAIWTADIITRPITALLSAVQELGRGNFAVKVNESAGSTEVRELSGMFNALGAKLFEHMESLRKETAAREAVENEIKIARRIQRSMLQNEVLEQKRPEIELVAELYPAKEVAGDFYDFFYLDHEESKLALLIADVSGKALSAAIFMAMAKTLIKNVCLQYADDPARALREANRLYMNSECMFVTMFLGYYDLTTGILRYGNAGHHDAILLRAGAGEYLEFSALGEPALGMFAGADYRSGALTFAPGDTLFIYTDGLTEAVNPGTKEFYGEARLKEVLTREAGGSPEAIARQVSAEITRFEDGNRFDDLAYVIFRRKA